jgi:hypothetical protein
LVDTLVLWLTVDNTLVIWSLAATSADSDTVDNISLLSLVAKLVGLVGTGWSVDALDLVALTILPSSDL